MIGEIHIGDAGLPFIKTMKDQNDAIISLAGCTAMAFCFWKPDGTTIQKTATLVNPPGTDGKLKYVTEAADLNQAGFWKWQVILTWGTVVLYSDVTVFRVYPNL